VIHFTSRIATLAILIASSCMCSCSDDVNNPPFEPPKTYYSLEEALEEPELVTSLFLEDIGDSLSPMIGTLSQLTDLRIGKSNIRFLPEEITNLMILRTLSLFDCGFEHIPDHIMQIPNLSSLYVTGCQIQDIPQKFGELDNIQWITFRDNMISNIPRGVLCTREIMGLSLDANRLSEFNFTIEDFPKLKFLSLEDNMFSDSVRASIIEEFGSIDVLEI